MNGYLTRLAARSLDRTDMIGPRPISRFEEPRHTVALYGERLGEREGTAIESSPNQELYHSAVEKQVRHRSLDRTGPVPQLISELDDDGSFAADMKPDTSRFTLRPDPVPRGSLIRSPFVREERPRLNQPLAPRHPRKPGIGLALEADPNRSEDLGPADVENERRHSGLERKGESPHTGVEERQAGQKHHRNKAVMQAPSSQIIPSVGSPASQQRTAVASANSQRPIVKVSIGRIDVRAIMPGLQAPKVRREETGPSQSLQEYLSRRSGGRR